MDPGIVGGLIGAGIMGCFVLIACLRGRIEKYRKQRALRRQSSVSLPLVVVSRKEKPRWKVKKLYTTR